MADRKNLERRLHALLGEARAPGVAMLADVVQKGRVAQRPFSEFIDDDLQRATALAERMMRAATAKQGLDGLEAATEEAETSARSENRELTQHALMLFMTHHPTGRKVRIPSLLRRAPNQVFGASASKLLADASAEPIVRTLESSSTAPEHRLDWWREDPLANEHHQHWHIVYPRFGISPDGQAPRKLKDRHGELFFYMHQQMLARYDAERLAIRLPRVKPLHDYRAAIDEGYDPGGLATGKGSDAIAAYAPRPPGVRLSDIAAESLLGSPYTVLQHEQRRDRLFDAAESGVLRAGEKLIPLTEDGGSDLLGRVDETTRDNVATAFYGNHHGFGHVLIGLSTDPQGDKGGGPGVIWNTATAIRDPAFWRWHKHVDELNVRHQERLLPHALDDAPTEVSLRDVILVYANDLSRLVDLDDEAAVDALGQHAFGDTAPDGTTQANANWAKTFESGDSTFFYKGESRTLAARVELETMMRQGEFELINRNRVSYRYLDKKAFGYFLRLDNTRKTPAKVTVRIFLAPSQSESLPEDGWANDRRLWIEMDKFVRELPAESRTVVYRSDRESSVIRRPVVDPANVVDLEPEDDAGDGAACECGWPYHLLLPRGTTEGMPFYLFAMVTDWEKDRTSKAGHCGSMSFCGAKDQYPDKRPMGYPFDRPLPRPLEDGESPLGLLIDGRKNIALRRIRIRCKNL
jgi:hypothetical protein